MTITPAIMYWFTRLDRITATFDIITLLGVFALLFLSIAYYATGSNTDEMYEHKVVKSVLKWLIPVWLFCLIGAVFIPNSKQMAMIYVVPQITESQVVKQDIPELYDLGVNALKDWLKKDKENGNNN